MRQRTKYTRWYNDVPVTNLWAVLSLLYLPRSSTDSAYITVERDICQVVIPWYTERDSGSCNSGLDYYEVDSAVLTTLQEQRLVTNLVTLGWGTREVDKTKWVATEHAYSALRTYEDTQQEKARGMLIPGVHTDLAGEATRLQWNREPFPCGELFYDFKGPNGVARVLPESDKLIFPFQS